MKHKDQKAIWWKHGVIYHIYPQSFKDTNADGTGDLQGIISKLDYLSELGVDALWLSPVYQSPLIDGGYDISDYYSIHPVYGTMEDFIQLLNEAHVRGIRIIMDMVLNHTSIRNPWFEESASSVNNPKRDWYIWHKPAGRNRKKPTNWRTNFGQSAWTLHEATGEYYYHSFFREQPDLNWRNPQVKEAMFDVIKYWLNLGIDGIRLDVINLLYKDARLRNNPFYSLFSNRKVYNRNRPAVYKLMGQLRALLDTYEDRVSIGEIYSPPPGSSTLANSFLGNGRDMLHLTFDFSLIFTPFHAARYYKTVSNYYATLPEGGWATLVISNHDLGRNLMRYIIPSLKYRKAKVLATLLLTLKGTPFIYYGDEIGMENAPLRRKDLRDRYGKMFYPFYKGRDKMRTPMQWNSRENAGFSVSRPWLPVHPNYTAVNLENEEKNPDSLYNLYKSLIAIRKQYCALHSGDIAFLNRGKDNVLIYKRHMPRQEIIVVLNFSRKHRKIKDVPFGKEVRILFSNYNRRYDDITGDCLKLEGFEVLIIMKELSV